MLDQVLKTERQKQIRHSQMQIVEEPLVLTRMYWVLGFHCRSNTRCNRNKSLRMFLMMYRFEIQTVVSRSSIET